ADIELAHPVGRARNTAGNELDRPRRVVGLQFAAEIIEDRLIAHYWYHTGRLSERTIRHLAEDHQKIMDTLLAAPIENAGLSRLASSWPPTQPHRTHRYHERDSDNAFTSPRSRPPGPLSRNSA